jgi:hypothetical protein
MLDLNAPIYTAHNIWYEQLAKVYSINYKKGSLIPIGSRVLKLETSRGWSSSVSFLLEDGARWGTIHFQAKFHPGLFLRNYVERTFVNTPPDRLLVSFSTIERQHIQQGIVRRGMSRRAVIAAFGFPPEHATPFLEGNHWLYWFNRFHKREVLFGSDGLTINDV